MSTAEVLLPRESGKFIAQSAKDVFIETKGVENLALEVRIVAQNFQIY